MSNSEHKKLKFLAHWFFHGQPRALKPFPGGFRLKNIFSTKKMSTTIATKLTMLMIPLITPLTISSTALALVVTPADIKTQLIKNSPQAKQIIATAKQAAWSSSLVEKTFDYNFAADGGYQNSHFETLQSSIEQEKNTTLNLSLNKPFSTGTNLGLLYSRNDNTPSYPGSVNTSANRSYRNSTSQLLGLSLQQNLWQNSFGTANRADLAAASYSLQAAEINRDVQLQNLIVNATKLYWMAVSSQETYQESIHARDRYKKLIETVQRKSQYGYANPGEFSQAQAELEAKEQNLNIQKIAANNALNDFRAIMGLPIETELQFEFKEDAPLANTLDNEKLLQNSKILSANKAQAAATRQALSAAESKSHPDLSLVALYNQQGLDNDSGESTTKLTNGSHNKYYLGLKISYSFGSDSQEKEILYRKLNQQLADNQLDIQSRSLQDQANQLRLRLEANLANLQSSKKQKGFREKAMQDISKTYSQGRSDISVYIDSMNKYYDAQVANLKALADYELTLSEWLALQDQLL